MGFGWNLTVDDQIYERTDPDTAAGVGFATEFLIVPLWGGCNWPCSGQKSGKLLSQCQHLSKAFLVKKKKKHRKLAIRWKTSTLVAIASSEVIKSADIRSWNSDFLSSDKGAEIPVHLQPHVLIESFITSEPKINALRQVWQADLKGLFSFLRLFSHLGYLCDNVH